MRTKSLVILSVLVLIGVFLTLGCTGSSQSSNNQLPSATTTQVVPDNSSVVPASTPADIANSTPADNGSFVPMIAPVDDLNDTTINNNLPVDVNDTTNVTDDNSVMVPDNNTSVPAYNVTYNGST